MNAPYRGEPPFVASSDTSQAAAHSMKDAAKGLRGKVLASLGSEVGATCDQLETFLNLSHQTVSARIRELFLMGKIERIGERKTRSGRKAAVWRERR